MRLNFLRNKEVKNAGWIICGKVAQMVLSLLVNLITARYLGVANYGLINYGASYVAFFSSLCTLGINSVIIKEFVDHPDKQGEALGTSLLLRAISSLLSTITIIGVVCVVDGDEPTTIVVVALSSLSLVFHVFDTINYWFQSRYQSKVTAIATVVAYAATSLYKIILLILGKSVRWFAFATSVDYIFVAIVLLIAYKKHGGQKFSISRARARGILSKSYHYILAGMMVSIYGQTDKLMLKQMLDETAVGLYSTATTICGMWTFLLAAIIDSMYPTVIRLHKESKDAFERKNRQLYAVVFYVSIAVSILFTLFGEVAIYILYGKEYLAAAMPLKIVTWYTAFSFLGVARNAWVVSENCQKYLKFIYIGAAVMNVAMNLALIPLWGASGAALASLITQIFTSVVLPSFFKEMRPNVKLMIEAICLKKIK